MKPIQLIILSSKLIKSKSSKYWKCICICAIDNVILEVTVSLSLNIENDMKWLSDISVEMIKFVTQHWKPLHPHTNIGQQILNYWKCRKKANGNDHPRMLEQSVIKTFNI